VVWIGGSAAERLNLCYCAGCLFGVFFFTFSTHCLLARVFVGHLVVNYILFVMRNAILMSSWAVWPSRVRVVPSGVEWGLSGTP
jgi:hypothetical protein